MEDWMYSHVSGQLEFVVDWSFDCFDPERSSFKKSNLLLWRLVLIFRHHK
jgi:hypothetical protein